MARPAWRWHARRRNQLSLGRPAWARLQPGIDGAAKRAGVAPPAKKQRSSRAGARPGPPHGGRPVRVRRGGARGQVHSCCFWGGVSGWSDTMARKHISSRRDSGVWVSGQVSNCRWCCTSSSSSEASLPSLGGWPLHCPRLLARPMSHPSCETTTEGFVPSKRTSHGTRLAPCRWSTYPVGSFSLGMTDARMAPPLLRMASHWLRGATPSPDWPSGTVPPVPPVVSLHRWCTSPSGAHTVQDSSGGSSAAAMTSTVRSIFVQGLCGVARVSTARSGQTAGSVGMSKLSVVPVAFRMQPMGTT
mmetsp:Transcript_98484/g.264698  ORF Transcript_98484/g.264698 Transcript_98484/m.264698 type:complete len:302 (+) Transcript_98484:31-936(+)